MSFFKLSKCACCHQHSIDISTIMEGVYAVIREMAAKFPDIAGLGVTSFGETFVLMDGEGNPLHLAMLYTDPRGAEECRELKEKMGEKNIARITDLRPMKYREGENYGNHRVAFPSEYGYVSLFVNRLCIV